ncbi:MAG: hypothetical protein IPJ32_18755 [Sphingobacteriaceae bacterium]|nr:hypothetical protein [Sphingobacteriaceae bacterium]
MLKIQDLLYHSKNYTGVNVCDYIRELVSEFKQTHSENCYELLLLISTNVT